MIPKKLLIARAMLMYMAEIPIGSYHQPCPLGFASNSDENWEDMEAIKEMAGVTFNNPHTMVKSMRAIARDLWIGGILEREKHSEYSERRAWDDPKYWLSYRLKRKWAKMLNPKWENIQYFPSPYSTPEFECAFALKKSYPEYDDVIDAMFNGCQEKIPH